MNIENTKSVSELMAQIESIEGVAVNAKLMCNGKMIEEGSLVNNGIQNHSEVQMFLPLIGGGDQNMEPAFVALAISKVYGK